MVRGQCAPRAPLLQDQDAPKRDATRAGAQRCSCPPGASAPDGARSSWFAAAAAAVWRCEDSGSPTQWATSRRPLSRQPALPSPGHQSRAASPGNAGSRRSELRNHEVLLEDVLDSLRRHEPLRAQGGLAVISANKDHSGEARDLGLGRGRGQVGMGRG